MSANPGASGTDGWITTPPGPEIDDDAWLYVSSEGDVVSEARARQVRPHWDKFDAWQPKPRMRRPDPYVPPSPDPWTVVAWHDMDTLDRDAWRMVLVRYSNGGVSSAWLPTCDPSDLHFAEAWCPVCPDLIAAVEQYANQHQEKP